MNNLLLKEKTMAKNFWLSRREENTFRMKRKDGFPQDDKYSICCDDGGSANLDDYYNYQFVHKEEMPCNELWAVFGVTSFTAHFPIHKPIRETISGNIFLADRLVASFAFYTDHLDLVGNPEILDVKFDNDYFLVKWADKVKASDVKMVISYEYEFKQ